MFVAWSTGSTPTIIKPILEPIGKIIDSTLFNLGLKEAWKRKNPNPTQLSI
jgi:hypothetical protein